MSYFVSMETPMTDQECLVEALKEQAPKKAKIGVNAEKVRLKGYGRGDAEIVIPAGTFGNHYEMGFAKQANGAFKLVAADDDIHRFDVNGLQRSYTEKKTMRTAKAQGMKFVRRDQKVDKQGKVNIQLIFEAARAR